MHMINFLYKVAGKTELVIQEENISKLSLPDLLAIMKAEQYGKIKLIIKKG